jgi:CPA2 family monovalent cation:H+ antiporter-2
MAILRDNHLMANPKSMTIFQAGDRVGLVGDKEEIESVEKLLSEIEIESESTQTGVEWET